MPTKSKKVLKDLSKLGFAVLGVKRVSDGLVCGALVLRLHSSICPPEPFLILVNSGIWPAYQLPSEVGPAPMPP